jgi:peptidylprolyl isomerase
MPGRRAARLLTPLAVVAGLALSACGGDDDPAARQATAEGTQPAQTETDAAADLRDTSMKPEIPKPTGSPPRRLVKEDIVKGEGPAARPGDMVVVHYVGVSFSTGAQFDASWDTGRPFSFPLGRAQVIEGWDEGIAGMRKGGRRMLTIPPEQAYGAQGFPPAIAPNETLVFVVDLVGIR